MGAVNKKYLSLQMLRGLAAWMVVYHHVVQLLFASRVESVIGAFFENRGKLGVDIFFVLSGYVMYLSAVREGQSGFKFLIDRLFRIAPVYWFYTILILVCVLFFPGSFGFTAFDLKSLILSLIFIPNENPSGIGPFPLLTVGWTLNFEVFFYLLLGVCLLVNRCAAAFLCMLIIFLLPKFYPGSAPYAFIAKNKLLYEFLAGMVLAYVFSIEKISAFISKHNDRLVMPSVVLLLVCLYLAPGKPVVNMAVAVSAVFLALVLEKYVDQTSRLQRIAIQLGDISYSTYLAHVIVIGVVLEFTSNNLVGVDAILAVMAITVVTWFISNATYHLIENNAALNTLKRAIFKRELSFRGATSGAVAEVEINRV